MRATARLARVPCLGACVLAFALAALPLRAETHKPAPDPAAETAELIQVATTLDGQISDILAELDAEIALQEENAGFGASAEALDQIDGLIARRADLAARQAQVRALLTALRGAD